jgi:hypothetical protein
VSRNLLLQFDGWCLIRLATDPDPTDEPRGVSGYTFAFAGEPDLDRVIHLHVPDDFVPRSRGPQIGVFVRQASRIDAAGTTDILAMQGSRVEFLDQPRLENRNWTLTLPGFEPIVPFHLRIAGKGIVLSRTAPFDPEHPDKPVWEIDEALLLSHAAQGMVYEPATIGRATGIWDSLQEATTRLQQLQGDLKILEGNDGDLVAITALQSRISELEYAVQNPNDRRVIARYYVERFGFPLAGKVEIKGDQQSLLGGALVSGSSNPWQIYFWIGAWDPDALCAYMQGSLEIPYAVPNE